MSKKFALVGPEVPDKFVDDGCSGCAPDRLLGVDISPACNPHDYEYHAGPRVMWQLIAGSWIQTETQVTTGPNSNVTIKGDYVRVNNGLNGRIAGAKRALRALKRARAPKDSIISARQWLMALKNRRRYCLIMFKTYRNLADRQLGENVKRCFENAGKTGWQRHMGFLVGRRYFGAVSRWGSMAAKGPGHDANFDNGTPWSLVALTQQALVKMEEELNREMEE